MCTVYNIYVNKIYIFHRQNICKNMIIYDKKASRYQVKKLVTASF